MLILKSNRIKDAVWALRCFDYSDTCLFQADVAESVLPIFEICTESSVPRLAIQAVRDFKAGKLTREQLANFADAASEVSKADTTTPSATCAAGAAGASCSYLGAPGTVGAPRASGASAVAFASASAVFAATFVAPEAATISKWNEIEHLFIKHFGE